MADSAFDRNSIAEDLGRRVKAIRNRQGLSLRDVAAVASVSPSLLGQIERGEASPSLLSLVAISDALGTTAGALLDGDATEVSDIVTRKADRRIMDAEFCRREYLMSPKDRLAEVAEFFVPVGGYTRRQLASHSGRDYGIVTAGTIVVEIGDEAFELFEGDFISFDGSVPHRLRNSGDVPARAHWVVIHADRRSETESSGHFMGTHQA